MKKKLLVGLLTMVVGFSVFGISASAAGPTAGDCYSSVTSAVDPWDCNATTDATYYYRGAKTIDVTTRFEDDIYPTSWWPEGTRVKLVRNGKVIYTSPKGVMAPGGSLGFVGYRSIPINYNWENGTYYVYAEFYDNNTGRWFAKTNYWAKIYLAR